MYLMDDLKNDPKVLHILKEISRTTARLLSEYDDLYKLISTHCDECKGGHNGVD